MGCTQSTQHAAVPSASASHKKSLPDKTSCQEFSSSSSSSAEPMHGRIVEFSSNVKDCYSVQKQIGEGSISNIYLVQRKIDTKSVTSSKPQRNEEQPMTLGSKLYALKEIDMDLLEPKFLDEMRNEINLLKMIDHPNILKAYEVYDTVNATASATASSAQKGPGISIVMEYCSGGDLNKRSPCRSEQEAKVIVAKIVEAINYLHLLGIIHRDIKHENIMFESTARDAEIKLIDFGLAQRYGKNERFTDKVGTVYTMSPQVIKGDYDKQTDMWSIGVVTYMLLVGEASFQGDTRKETAQKIVSGKYSMEGRKWMNISREAKEFIKKCLQIEPKLRYTADQALKSPWLSEITSQKSEDLRRQSTRNLLNHIAAANSAKNLLGEDDDFDNDEEEAEAKSSEFRKMVLFNIAHKTSSQDEILKLRQVFHSLDSNHDGTLSMQELRTGLKHAGFGNDVKVDKWFQKANVNPSGEISYTEFIAALLETQGELQRDKVSEAFHSFDLDRSGYITRQNLKDALGVSLDSDYVERLVQEADTDGDGKISFEEFQAVINRETVKNKRRLMNQTTGLSLVAEGEEDESE